MLDISRILLGDFGGRLIRDFAGNLQEVHLLVVEALGGGCSSAFGDTTAGLFAFGVGNLVDLALADGVAIGRAFEELIFSGLVRHSDIESVTRG